MAVVTPTSNAKTNWWSKLEIDVAVQLVKVSGFVRTKKPDEDGSQGAFWESEMRLDAAAHRGPLQKGIPFPGSSDNRGVFCTLLEFSRI